MYYIFVHIYTHIMNYVHYIGARGLLDARLDLVDLERGGSIRETLKYQWIKASVPLAHCLFRHFCLTLMHALSAHGGTTTRPGW